MVDDNSTIEGNSDSSWIPEGFVEVLGPNAQRYLVPEFYESALHNSLNGFMKKTEFEMKKAYGTVSLFNFDFFGAKDKEGLAEIILIPAALHSSAIQPLLLS